MNFNNARMQRVVLLDLIFFYPKRKSMCIFNNFKCLGFCVSKSLTYMHVQDWWVFK